MPFSFLKKLNTYKELYPTFFTSNIIKIDKNYLIDKVYDYKKGVKKGNIKSNRGGYQSFDNLHVLKDFKDTVNIVENFVFENTEQKIKIQALWFNINSPYTYNDLHDHKPMDRSLFDYISGVIYVKVPEGDSGTLQFLSPYEFNSKYPHEPKEGELVLFPTYVGHSVTPNYSKEDRISLAFNAQIIWDVETQR